jgi:hypothetical protein
MKRCFAFITILALLAAVISGCEEAPVEKPTPEEPATVAAEEGSFSFLISDDVNAIENFEHLYVTISSIGVHRVDESGEWILLDPEPDPDGDGIPGLDLRPLTGENALEIWSGNVTAGKYTKVFIYVESVEGVLVGGGSANVTLPSGKLQISKAFEITEDSATSFVYDITVIEAGKSGKYILKPQIAQSGADQKFTETKRTGKPEEPGKPEKTGKPEKAGKPEKTGKPGDDLDLQLQGELGLGASVTLIVTDDGSPVEGATVTINGEELEGKTDVNGSLILELPGTPGEVKIEAAFEGRSGELEFELEEPGEQSEWFEGEGTITAVTEGAENASPWTMTLEGIEGPVTVYVVELEGTPAVDARAKIEGVLLDNTIENARAEIEEEEE